MFSSSPSPLRSGPPVPVLRRPGIASFAAWKSWLLSLALLWSGIHECTVLGQSSGPGKRPNILWFIVDDMSPNFGCYGETTVRTPNVDRLAREGVRFTRAFITAPVCSPCRSGLITGMYPTTIGSHQHRSGRGQLKIHLPEGVVPVPVLFKQSGYYTCIGSGRTGDRRLGKTDYNFEWDPAIYDGPDWADRRPGQPFFMQVQLAGGKHRDGQGWRRLDARYGTNATRIEAVGELPPYYPRDPEILKDWAHYLDSVRTTDEEVGEVLKRLEAEGLMENTLIVFMTDHGISHARGKQFLYNEGTHVPLVIRGPGIKRGTIRGDLVEHIDLAALSLAAAGIPIPRSMQGQDILGKNHRPKDAVFAARDRCDETVERIRSVRTSSHLYIRNYHPRRPHLQPNRYKDAKPTLIRLRQLKEENRLPELSRRLLFAGERPEEELYEWNQDRWQIRNLAADPAQEGVLKEMRARLDRWMADTGDKGAESEAMYDSDMQVYLDEIARQKQPLDELQRNIALMKQWKKEGR